MAHTGESLEKKRETENFTRINRLLQRVATPVVKVHFDSEFHPTQLKSTLTKGRSELEKQKKSINQYQLSLLYPANGEPSSFDFDLTLLISLLRHLDTKVPISDKLPIVTDTSIAASLSRLKYYRNQVAHNQTLTLSCTEFEIWWNDVTNAICVLGGESYKEKCKQLKYCPLDGKDLPLEIKKIANSVRELEKEEYLYWIEDIERYFPIPSVIDDITAALKQHHFIVISGHSGTGKTALARYVALNLHKTHDMSIFPVKNPNTIQQQLALRYQINSAAHKLKVKKVPASGKKKQTKPIKVIALDAHTKQSILIFVVDDFLGRYTINKRLSNAWKELYYEHFYIPSNEINSIYIIATCREDIRGTFQFKSLKDLYNFKEYNTSEMGGNIADKQNVASCHMNPSTVEIVFADKKIQKEVNFYTFCFLYSHYLLTENVDFFKNPYLAFGKEFEEIRCRSEPCYIGLALLTIYDGKLNKPLSNQVSVELVSKLCEKCQLRKSMKLSQIQQELEIVVGRYIIDEVTAYSLVHPEFYEILLHYFIKKIPESLIAFGSNDFLQTRVQLEKSTNESSNFVSVVIEENHAEIYFDRLIEEIKLNQFENAFQNMQVANVAYQEQLIQHIQKYDKILHILASSCLPLILSVENNSSELVRLILKKREEFNMSREVEIERQDDFDLIDYEDRKLLNLQSTINDEEIILMLACLCGSARVVELLLALEYDINYQNAMQKAPIHLACLRGNDEVVKVLLGIQSTEKEDSYRQISVESDCDIDIQDANGLTALHMACRTGHTKVVNLLLNKWKCSLGDTEEQSRIALFADKFSVTDNQRRLAFHLAAESSSAADIFEILFQAISLSDCIGTGKHADAIHEKTYICDLINTQDKDGKTVLFTACENDNNDCVAFLLKYRCCKINICNDRNETPMFRVCQNDNTNLVDILIENKADVNIKDVTGRTPLHVCVENKNGNMVKSILKNKNCNVNARDRADYTALYLAVCRKNFEIVEALLKADCITKCDLNLTHANQKTPLLAAISTGSAKIVNILIASDCDLSKYDNEGRKAFHIACEINYDGDIIALFLQRKQFDINDLDCDLGRTGLHYAVIGNNIKAVKLLIKEKININKQDKNGQTAIYHAFRCNKLEMVKELLKSRECDINLHDNTGTSMLHIACGNNDISMVRTLLRRAKCAINAQDKQGRTPLHVALSSKYLDIVALLVKTTDLNTKDSKGQTPLHIACETQRIEAVKLILKSGCDVNVQDNSGKTALHIAAEGWEPSIVDELLKVNCNAHLCDNNGKTALFFARANRNKDIVLQFQENSGNGRE